MKNQEDANNQIGLDQANSIFQIWKELKNSIFNVLFVLLNQSDDGEDQSIIGLGLQTGLDYLQMMSFPFHDAIIQVWNGGETLANFSGLFTNLSVNKFIPGVGFSTFLIMLYALIFVIILVILDIIYVSYSFSKKKFTYTWPLIFLAKVVPLCVTVFFLPIMQTLLSVVSCQKSQQSNGQVMESFPDVNCWQGWHMFHAVITLFFTSIFVFISSIVALTIFQPRMTTNRLTARQNSSGQVIFIVNKMICQFVFSFTPFEGTWVYSIMLFGLAGWLYTSYNVEQPFYNKSASKFFRICSSYYFWTNLMLMVSQILVHFGFQGGLVIWMCGLPFIGLSIVFQRKSNIDKLFSSNLKFRSGQELEAHLQYVLQLIHNRLKDKNSYMLLLGYIEKHIEVCMEEDCPLKIKKLKKQENLTEIEESCNQLIKQILRMFKQGVKKYPQCTRLRLGFAFFYMEMLHSNNKAYQQFTIASNTDPSFGEQFIIYRFKKIIRENLQQKEEDQENDLIEIIRFDNHVSLCEQAMLYSARLHKEFWTELQQQTPDLKKLNYIGSKITQTTINVKQNYEQVQKINNHVPQIIHNYALYLMFVGQSETEGKKILEQSKRIFMEKKLTQQNDLGIFLLKNSQYGDLTNIDNNFNSLIKISGQKESLGRIIYSNKAFTQLTGYLKEDITERSIDKIIPAIYDFYHTDCMQIWLSNDEKKVLTDNNNYISAPRKGYIRQKSGFILPVDYRVSFDIEQKCFRTLVRTDPLVYNDFNYKIYIAVNGAGVIRDISILGYLYFKIGREQCQSGQYILEELGIPSNLDNSQLYSKKGIELRLEKVEEARLLKTHTTLIKNMQILETLNKVQNLDSQSNFKQKVDEENNELFLIKAEELWIIADQNRQQIDEYNMDYENGRVRIGSLYILEKMKNQKQINPNQQKNNQLNIFQDYFDELYKQDQINQFLEIEDLFQRQKNKKSKILADMLIKMNNGQALTFTQKKFINYGQQLKIKTYRYFDKDYKRLYGIEYQNDQSNQFMYENDDLCGIKDIKKLQNKHYQRKIKEAINTNIEHQQITSLRIYSVCFLIVLLFLTIISFVLTLNQLQKIAIYSNDNYERCNDISFLTLVLQKSIQQQNGMHSLTQKQEILNILTEHQIVFKPKINVECQIENGDIKLKSVFQVMNMVQARVINYFNAQSLNKNIHTAYSNYFLSIYDAIEAYHFSPNIEIQLLFVLTALTLLNAAIMVCVWIFNIMKIDQKRFDIMIWFLDIPVEYILYLQANCNRFIKNYISIKELQQRGINMDDKQHYCDEFKPRKIDKDEELDQQNKARKILIARHRKKTFFSRFSLSYLQLFWLLLYSVLVAAVLNCQIIYQKNKFQFVIEQWQTLSKQFLWSSSLPIALSLKSLGSQAVSNSIKSINLTQFQEGLRRNFLNTYTARKKVDSMNKLIDQDQQISQIFATIYYGNICNAIVPLIDLNGSLNHLSNCQSVLNSKLQGGFSTYTSYLVNLEQSQQEDIAKAQFQYVGPGMMIIFQQWRDFFIAESETFKMLSNVVVYLYIVITLIGFAAGWLVYLKNQNIKMNQTIQMLNMIPIQMLPKTRKDTRDYLNWLIAQASKMRDQD